MRRQYASVGAHLVRCRSGERDEGKIEKFQRDICLAVAGDS
jgi:hypothetical protein